MLAGLLLAASPLRAGETAPSAAALARKVDVSRDLNALLIRDENGAARSLSEWHGRWVVLNLWGPWCLPCKEEMPSLVRLAAHLDPARARSFRLPLTGAARSGSEILPRRGIEGFPVLMGDGENLDAVLGLSALPTTLVIDPSGRHAFTIAGEAVWDDKATLNWLDALSG